MSTKINYILRINGEITYDCTAYTVANQTFAATVVSGDVTQVRNDLSDISLIEILNKDNTVLYSSTSFTKLSSANLRIGFGYNDETHTAFDLIQLGFEKIDLEKKVAELETRNAELEQEVTNNQLALCELYELLAQQEGSNNG